MGSTRPGATRRRTKTRPRATDLGALDLEELLALLPQIEEEAQQSRRDLAECVEQLRARRASWREIGDALQVSRQAVWQRFGAEAGSDRS